MVATKTPAARKSQGSLDDLALADLLALRPWIDPAEFLDGLPCDPEERRGFALPVLTRDEVASHEARAELDMEALAYADELSRTGA